MSPTASLVVDLLATVKRPLSTAEIAERASIHPNSVRHHLSRLLDAGIVEAGSHQGQRGRPRKTWLIAPGYSAGPDASYRELATWLSESVSAVPAGTAEVRERGRAIGIDIAQESDGDGGDVLRESLRTMGFRPKREGSGTRTLLTLCNCPYREVAKDNGRIVCSLHLGIAEGILAGSRGSAEVTSFVPRDPYTAGCTIEYRSAEDAGEGAA